MSKGQMKWCCCWQCKCAKCRDCEEARISWPLVLHYILKQWSLNWDRIWCLKQHSEGLSSENWKYKEFRRLSSNIVSLVYIHCQSQRTRPKENWYSVWLSWCCLKPNPGVCSNPWCAPHTTLLQQMTSFCALPNCMSSLALIEAHTL